MSQITSDGRGARAADRAAHSSLIWGAPSTNFLMYGITNKEPEELVPLAESWNNPPAIIIEDNLAKWDYIPQERAYHISPQNDSIRSLSFRINASEGSPLLNPSFLVKNWNSEIVNISLNGKELIKNKDYQIGFLSTAVGTDIILSLNYQSINKAEVKFSKE